MHNIDVVHALKIAEVPTQSKRSFMTCRVLAPLRSSGMDSCVQMRYYIYVISHHDLYQDKTKN